MKIGDRVKVVLREGYGETAGSGILGTKANKGRTGKVLQIDDEGRPFESEFIKFDDEREYNEVPWWIEAKDLQLINDTEK